MTWGATIVDVDPEDLRDIYEKLGCSARQLADTLGVSHREVMDWEVEKRFPTKRHVDRMKQLLDEGPGALAPKRIVVQRARETMRLQLATLEDAVVWTVIEKLLDDAEFRQRALDLARTYDEPGDEAGEGDSEPLA